MGEFHQHPDGMIFVRTDVGLYADTVENFQRDAGVTLDPLPEGADDRIYTQGKRHAMTGGGNVIAGGAMPWPDGDNYIADIADLLAAQAARAQSATDMKATQLDMGGSIQSVILGGG